MEFTSREIASVIVFLSLVAISVLSSRDRSEQKKSLIGLFKAASVRQVWTVALVYVAYVGLVVFGASALGIWGVSLLKDTLIATIFTGFPLILNASKLRDGSHLVSSIAKGAVGVSALLVVYINLTPLVLWAETIFQALVLLLVLLIAFGRLQPENAKVVRLFEWILGILGIWLLVRTTVILITDSGSLDWAAEGSTFALSVWLPLSLVPFVYVLAMVMSIEMTFVRLRLHADPAVVRLRVYVAFVLGTHLRLVYASAFVGQWLGRLAEQNGFRKSLAVMSEFRRSVKSSVRLEKARRKRLARSTGVRSFDTTGLWQDRREFHETKEALEYVFFIQMGQYRHRGAQYRTETIVLYPPGGFKDLPKNHGVEVDVRDDRKAWMAWRVTVSGFVLAVGGSSDVDARWRWAGTTPPEQYPASDSEGWTQLMLDTEGYFRGEPNWDHDDSPIARY